MSLPIVVPAGESSYSTAYFPLAIPLSATATPEFGIREWEWLITGMPVDSYVQSRVSGDFTNGISSSPTPTLTVDVAGAYEVSVRARNELGWSYAASQRILVARTEDVSAALAAATTASTAANAALAAANAALQTTPRPILNYQSATLINIDPSHGYSECRLTFQDGVSRRFTVAPTFNPALGAVEGGLDVGVEAPSTWYYLYLVPTAANNALLCCRGSVNNPSVGPVGYANFKYIGAVYNDAGSNLVDFHHEGDSQFKLETQALAINAGPVGPDGAAVDTNLSAFVPWTADSVVLYGDLEGPAGGTVYEWRFGMHAVGGFNIHLEVRGSSTICILAWDQAIHTPQHIWRQLVRTAGVANATVTQLYVNGWDDGWLQ